MVADRRQAALLPRDRHAVGVRALHSRSATSPASSDPASWQRWLGLVPSLDQSGESAASGAITKTGSGFARRLLVEAAWHYLREPRIGATLANRQPASPTTSSRSPGEPSIASTASSEACAHAANPATSPSSPSRANSPASSGRPPSPTDPNPQPPGEEGAGPTAAGTRGPTMGSPPRRRPFLDKRTPATQQGPWGSQPPHHQTGEAVKRPGAFLTA